MSCRWQHLNPISSALLSSSCSKLLDEGQSGTTAGTTPGGNNGKLPRQNSVKDSFFLSRLPEAEKLDEIMKIEEAENSKKSPGEESSGNSATLSRKGSCAVGAAITVQYFSEPEMSPVTSPIGSRPGSPILSDTGMEIGYQWIFVLTLFFHGFSGVILSEALRELFELNLRPY